MVLFVKIANYLKVFKKREIRGFFWFWKYLKIGIKGFETLKISKKPYQETRWSLKNLKLGLREFTNKIKEALNIGLNTTFGTYDKVIIVGWLSPLIYKTYYWGVREGDSQYNFEKLGKIKSTKVHTNWNFVEFFQCKFNSFC